MSDVLEKNVRDIFNEEKWTRAAITNYSINNFKELDTLIEEAKKNRYLDELKALSDEHLSHNKTSITALYISSIIALSKQLLDDSSLITLVTIFIDNHRMQIVEYLCQRVLEFGDSKFALRTLANCYKESGNGDIYDIWERLTRIDYEEADIPKQLAERYQQMGDMEKAVEYYKKALYRYINRHSYTAVKEVWARLVELVPQEIDFFYHVQRKIADHLGAERGAALMQDLYDYYKKEKDWNTAIDILKLVLTSDDKDNWARKEIVECFREKYASHSQLEEYIKVSNLTQSWRNVFEAIDDFEKHISFDEGCFVFHRTWGVGRIAKVNNDELVIDFAKKRGHTMSLKMGITALQTLDKDHIWVLKSIMKRDELAAKVKTNPEWALKNIIRSFDNNCDFKRIKHELVPSLLTDKEWTTWSTKARKVVKENPEFGINPTNIDFYTVHTRPISLEEKLSNEFKAQKNFFERVEIIFNVMESGDTDSDSFQDMINYFDAFLKAFSQVNEQVIAAYLVMSKLTAALPHLSVTQHHNFAELFAQIENPAAIYRDIENKELRSAYLRNIKNLVPDWSDQYIRLFPVVLSAEILNPLLEEYPEKVKDLVLTCFKDYKEYREAVIWFFKNAQEEQWFKDLNIDYEHEIIVLIHILDITYREIASRRNTTENRKINKQIHTILFGKEALLENFILDHDEDAVTRLYTLVSDIKDLDPPIKMQLRNRILEKYKNFKFFDEVEKTVTGRGLIVTSKMLEEKKKELQRLIEVEIPRNSKEVGFALSLGDLRENSEYKAAKEEQNRLNNTVSRLQEELERAQVFDPTTITTTRVGFGTIVVLEKPGNSEKETYTILGPWESDPENGVISYMSPLGTNLLNHKVGETLSFMVNEEEKTYKLLDISAAVID
ncbi:transcription elongation factor GreA [Treponema sp. OMZ 838]|uniref:transcription elongation factor GreA n=1 Tax=Treponema sp. OMZ 838 TaxID=1539298 RepID=UPI00053012A2|nr:transcription elongation factor GreA [Treponema sp. OMZ 838]AIW88384.1 transcription elongation factor GreA [Treponema sp. OMZ 838]